MAVTDILITPAAVWRSPVGEALPDESSVAYGAAWGGNWVDVGHTLQPVTVAYNREIFDLMVEQVPGPVKRRVTSEQVIIESVLSDVTPDNVQLAIGGSVTTTAAGSGQVGFQDLDAGGDIALDERQWGLEGLYEDSAGAQFPVRIFVYKATSVLNGPLNFAKAAGVGVPISITALNDTGKSVGSQLIKFQRVTAAAT